MNMQPFHGYVYYGTNAGEELVNRLNNAQNEIKVMSPYLDSAFIEILERKQSMGVKVQIITTNEAESKKDKNKIFSKFVIQDKIVDEPSLKKYRNYTNMIYLTFLFAFIALVFALYKRTNYYLYILPLLICFVSSIYFKIRNNLIVFKYTYKQRIPFKVLLSPHKDWKLRKDDHAAFFHNKVYIIDGMLFTGSVNLTLAGTKYNCETMIMSNDPASVEYGTRFFDSVFNSGYYYVHTVEELGKRYNYEPVHP